MITKKLPAAALVLALGTLLVGCPEKSGEKAEASLAASAAPASAQPAKAFWKQDKGGVAASTETTTPVAAVKAGWTALPEVDEHLADKGKQIFDTKGCAACHGFGKKIVGPDLNNITTRVEPEWLKAWIANPEPMLASDPYAKELLARYLVKMPNQQVKPDEIKALMEFLRQHDHQLAEKAGHGDEHHDKDHGHS